MAIIHDRIKQRRTELGYTLLGIADRLNIKEATMQRYESGAIKNIKHETIAALSEILNCDPAYLMGWTDAPNKSEYEELYAKLDETDKAEIRGEMRQMLKADKYSAKADMYDVGPYSAYARIAASGHGTREIDDITAEDDEIVANAVRKIKSNSTNNR